MFREKLNKVREQAFNYIEKELLIQKNISINEANIHGRNYSYNELFFINDSIFTRCNEIDNRYGISSQFLLISLDTNIIVSMADYIYDKYALKSYLKDKIKE